MKLKDYNKLCKKNAPSIMTIGFIFFIGSFVINQTMLMPEQFRGGVFLKFSEIQLDNQRAREVLTQKIDTKLNEICKNLSIGNKEQNRRIERIMTMLYGLEYIIREHNERISNERKAREKDLRQLRLRFTP